MNMQSFLGSEFLDLGIGMSLLFLFVSLICAALREVIEGWRKSRAHQLHLCMREILNDHNFCGLVRQIYTHPSVYALYFGRYPRVEKGRWWRNLPSYIPPANFSNALLDIVVRGDPEPISRSPSSPDTSAPAPPPTAITTIIIREKLASLDNQKLERAILSAFDFASDDLAAARTNLETWYNAAMDRVSGVYKRQTQTILFIMGLTAAALLNIDSITVIERLSQNKALRDAVISQAQTERRVTSLVASSLVQAPEAKPPGPPANAPTAHASAPLASAPLASVPLASHDTPPLDPALDLRLRMESVGLPIGWDSWFQPQTGHASASLLFPTPQSRVVPCGGKGARPLDCDVSPYFYYVSPQEISMMVLGWFITAFAITLGAPFWFDVLNRFMVVRSTVKPQEKSQDEASKDPRPKRPDKPDQPERPDDGKG